MAKLSRNLGPGALLPTASLDPRENLFIAGNLGALNAEIITDTDGCQSVMLDLRGTFSLTVELSGTVDGTNWVLIPVRNILGGLYLASIVGTAAGIWTGTVSGFRRVRARVTAYTSGTAIATLCASNALLDLSPQTCVTPSTGTVLGTGGAAATLTLAAPGVGLRHYLTYLRIVRFATALLTAAAAPVAVTTTNLPGSMAFTFPADAAAQGTVFAYQEDFSFPVVSVAQNTATTIVCPATTGVIWRVTAGFYVAP
jgi:hypothetical protein